MSLRLENRITVVTGAGRGIGFATARLFAAEGAQVIIAELDPALAKEAAVAIGANAEPVVVDVASDSAVENLFAGIHSRFGRLDILVCNAGRPYQTTSLQASEQDWDACLDVNLKSAWLCARAAHSLLAASETGNIVTVASAQGLRSGKASFPYSAAKGGLLALTRTLAVEFAPRIRVNAIIPGQIESVRTEPFFNSFRNPAEARRRVMASFPMARLGKPEDIAKAILFLSSEDAAWITGTFLTVDGGRDAAMLDLSDLRENP
jgi:NAD(P)-dependent dehydrogenase (short-subunit alcohol dehydrogenase family)